MEIDRVCHALSSASRLKIIRILGNGDQTASEVFKKIKEHRNGTAHRETIYRDLELLQKAGILNKVYDIKSKRLFYHLVSPKIIIDLLANETVRSD